MTATASARKAFIRAAATDIPSMVAKSDIDLIARHLDLLPPNPVIVEFGPWLGSISVHLAKAGQLHAVDNFVWTKDHARRVPDVLDPGDSFRALYEAVLKKRGLKAAVHATPFTDFAWNGPKIDLVVIDGPKAVEGMIEILSKLIGHVGENTIILIKNALNPSYPEVVLTFHALMRREALIASEIEGPVGNNMLACRVGPTFADLAGIAENAPEEEQSPEAQADDAFLLAEIQRRLTKLDWQGAYDQLSKMSPSLRMLTAWDEVEGRLDLSPEAQEDLAVFSDIYAFHHGSAGIQPGSIAYGRSAAQAMRAYWLNNADKPWRGTAFRPEILSKAFDYGYMSWPSKIQDQVRGKDVIDIGCGSGLHGLGFLVAGVNSYLGVDPVLECDRDRVKNLTQKKKDSFGWTPNEISRLLPPWQVRACMLDQLPDERSFDIAVMNDATEHLFRIEDVFRDLAKRMRPGGALIYTHHNFYAWNGHHMAPKTISAIKQGDPAQKEMMDWAHIAFDPPPEHYIARSLNRVRLDELIALTEKYFDIEIAEETLSGSDDGALRITDRIRNRYPHLTDRDLLTQNLRCIARVRI